MKTLDQLLLEDFFNAIRKKIGKSKKEMFFWQYAEYHKTHTCYFSPRVFEEVCTGEMAGELMAHFGVDDYYIDACRSREMDYHPAVYDPDNMGKYNLGKWGLVVRDPLELMKNPNVRKVVAKLLHGVAISHYFNPTIDKDAAIYALTAKPVGTLLVRIGTNNTFVCSVVSAPNQVVHISYEKAYISSVTTNENELNLNGLCQTILQINNAIDNKHAVKSAEPLLSNENRIHFFRNKPNENEKKGTTPRLEKNPNLNENYIPEGP